MFFAFVFFFCPQRSPVFVGQSGLMNFTIYVSGEDCNVPEKRVSLELEDKSVFSVVVGIKNDEIVFGKVMLNPSSVVLGRNRSCFDN